MAPLIGFDSVEIPSAVSTPAVAWVTISVFFLFAAVLSVWICGCCEKGGDHQQGAGGNAFTGVGTDPKHQLSQQRSDDGSKNGSGSKNESVKENEGRTTPKKRKAPKVIWSKSTVLTAPSLDERGKTKKKSKDQEEPEAEEKTDQKTENPETDSKLPTVLRNTGLSPPPSLHVPTTAYIPKFSKKTKKPGDEHKTVVYEPKLPIGVKTAIQSQAKTSSGKTILPGKTIASGKTTVLGKATAPPSSAAVSKTPDPIRLIQVTQLPLRAPESKLPIESKQPVAATFVKPPPSALITPPSPVLVPMPVKTVAAAPLSTPPPVKTVLSTPPSTRKRCTTVQAASVQPTSATFPPPVPTVPPPTAAMTTKPALTGSPLEQKLGKSLPSKVLTSYEVQPVRDIGKSTFPTKTINGRSMFR